MTLPADVTAALERARLLEPDSRRHNPRVVDDDERVPDLLRQLGEGAVPNGAGRAVVDEQA